MSNFVNKDYYLPILEEFYKQVGEDLVNCGYDQNPFVPYTFPNYCNADLKVFYIGQDTRGWKPKINKPYNRENVSNYLDSNAAAVDLDTIRTWRNRTSFWGMVVRLQLMLKTGQYFSDITALTETKWNIVSEVGYGNLNSIELQESIEYRDECEITDTEAYNRVVEAAKPLQSLSGIIKAYNPDILFILSWSEIGNELTDMGFVQQEDLFERPFSDVYINPATKKIVIRTNHPSSYKNKYLSTNMEEMCYYLAKTYMQAKDAINRVNL